MPLVIGLVQACTGEAPTVRLVVKEFRGFARGIALGTCFLRAVVCRRLPWVPRGLDYSSALSAYGVVLEVGYPCSGLSSQFSVAVVPAGGRAVTREGGLAAAPLMPGFYPGCSYGTRLDRDCLWPPLRPLGDFQAIRARRRKYQTPVSWCVGF